MMQAELRSGRYEWKEVAAVNGCTRRDERPNAPRCRCKPCSLYEAAYYAELSIEKMLRSKPEGR